MPQSSRQPKVLKCGVQISLSVIGGRWKLVIIYFLLRHGTLRFGELNKIMPLISKKVLTSQLRELEKDGTVCRQVHDDTHVAYTLTEYGLGLKDIVLTLRAWGENHAKQTSQAASVNI